MGFQQSKFSKWNQRPGRPKRAKARRPLRGAFIIPPALPVVADLNRSGFSLLELLVAFVLGALFLTGALMMCALHRSIWFTDVRLNEARLGLIAPACSLARSLRVAGGNPLSVSSFTGIECLAGHAGDCESIIIRSDHRGKDPGSAPDGDRDDPGETLVFTYDVQARLIRRNGQPFAERIVENPDGEPMFSLDSSIRPRLAKITLTGRGCLDEKAGGDRCLTESLCMKVALRNMP